MINWAKPLITKKRIIIESTTGNRVPKFTFRKSMFSKASNTEKRLLKTKKIE